MRVRSVYRARYVPRVLEGRALLAVVCHGALRVVRAVRLKSTGPGVRVRRVALQLENNCKCSQAICTVVSATCNSHVLLHRQRLIVEVVHEVDAETFSRRRRYRTWQGAVNVEQCVSVQMRSDAVVEPSLGCEVEHAFERDDREQCGRRQARGSRCTRVCWSRYAPRVFHRDANCNLAPSRSFGR